MQAPYPLFTRQIFHNTESRGCLNLPVPTMSGKTELHKLHIIVKS